MNEQEVARIVQEAAGQVHQSQRRAGLDEQAYRNALAYDLEQRGLSVEAREIPPGNYQGVKLTRPQTIDMIVDGQLVVECHLKGKSDPRWEAEALAHLRLANLKMALVINFGERSLRTTIRRVMNT
jgi:GxxExxY protein